MIDSNIIIHEAEEYINNTLTLSETSKKLGISKRTLQLHFKRLEEIDKNLYNQVEQKKSQNINDGKILGGQQGKRTSSYTKEEAEKIAITMINQGLTYRAAEKFFKIPKSTIYEILHSGLLSEELISELDMLADDNKHNDSESTLGIKW